MRYYILGGGGFIGCKLAQKIAAMEENQIVIADRVFPKELSNYKNISFQKIDFLEKDDYSKEVSSADVIYHLVCTITPSDNTEDLWDELEQNLRGTIALLDALKEAKHAKLVFVSSGGTVYGETTGERNREDDRTDPVCSYAIIKTTIESYIKLYGRIHGIDYKIVRLANPFGVKMREGQKQGIIPIFIDKIIKNEPIPVFGDGLKVRDYIYIDDAIAGMLAVEKNASAYQIYNIGSGTGHSIIEILDIIKEKMNCSEMMVEQLPERKCDVQNSILDISRIMQETGWSPKVSLEDGIEMLIHSLNEERESVEYEKRIYRETQ